MPGADRTDRHPSGPLGGLVGALLAAVLLVGPSALPAAASPVTRLRFPVVAHGDPAEQAFRTVGPYAEVRYGNGTLRGTAVIAGVVYDAELLGTLRYVDGSGPFVGSWTFTSPAGDRLALRYRARVRQRTAATRIVGTLAVLGGTGALVDVTGTGRVTGVRRTDLGGDVRYEFALRLRHFP